MAKMIDVWNGNTIFEHDYDRWKGHEECNGLTTYGVAYKLYHWLKYNDLLFDEEDVDDVFANMSCARDGNRYDIHDNYKLWDSNGMEISFLYVVNGNVWATILKDNGWYGDIELPNF